MIIDASLSETDVRVLEQGAGIPLTTVTRDEAIELARLGHGLIAAGDLANALKALSLAMPALRDNDDAVVTYARALALNQRTLAARQLFALVARRQPTRIDVWCALGELRLDAMNYRGAAAALKKCLELDPNGEHPAGRRARAVIKKGEKLLKSQVG